MAGHLYIISGCSGVGKGTLLKKFLDRNPQVILSVVKKNLKRRLRMMNFLNGRVLAGIITEQKKVLLKRLWQKVLI